MGKRTVLYPSHLAAKARMVDFGGWDMPLHYGSQLEEHHQVRRDAGVFDVSHMAVVDVTGSDALAYLRRLLANDVARLQGVGRALYSVMLNEAGGILDDLIVYRLDDGFRVVLNCATAENDLAWMSRQAEAFTVEVTRRLDLAMLAVQGPRARERCAQALGAEQAAAAAALEPFCGVAVGGWYLARTGYTGEQGYEIMLPGEEAPAFWQRLLDARIGPAGLGARDTLRLEAGMNLYGADMNASCNPLESGLGWTLALQPAERDFIGRRALQAFAGRRRQVGLVLRERGVLRAHQQVFRGEQLAGEITSGGHSPTLGHSIALARLDLDVWQGGELTVDIRQRRFPVEAVRPPFVREGVRRYRTWQQE